MQTQPETTDKHAGNTLVQYREVNAIFRNSPVEDTTTKERTTYVNEARRDNYLAIVTRPPISPGRLVFLSEDDSYSFHFPITTLVTIHIGCCKVSKILVDGVSRASTFCMATL